MLLGAVRLIPVFNPRTFRPMSQGQTSQRLRPFKPQPFGRYTLLMPLSTGGMGEIFLAQLQGAHGFDKLCVIKKILPHLTQDQDFVSRFVDEARTLVKLSHGNIAQVLDMGVQDGSPWISLEFIDGKDLRRVLSRMRERNLPLPLSFVLMVMTRVLDALAYAHRKRADDDSDLNLVHRDVSPQNVLISYEGEVKVIDFGLAKSTMSLAKTNPSIVLGKFMYMSPEQARHKAVDRRSDLYAAGLCLWELVTGKNPFDDVPPGELMARVANPQIPPLNTVEPLCPMALSDVVAKALAVDPAQRFQSAEEFRGKLQGILQDIDPLAGAETASRFMRDAFAAEYQAERRMLATVKEQARALQPDDEPAQESASEETADNMMSPFAAAAGRPTPLATPAVTLPLLEAEAEIAASAARTIELDDETPAANRLTALQPEALSFAPTRKSGGSVASSKKGTDHERETMPSILSRPDAPAPAPIRARVLAKSFDQESTEAATPAIAEPEPLPSIVIDGLPSEAVRTELEIPVQGGGPPPRASKAQPKVDFPVTKKVTPKPKPGADKPKAAAKETKPLKASRPPPAPQRTDTMIIRNPVADVPPDAAPEKKKAGVNWVWFVIPALAIAAVGGFIAWDVYSDAQKAKAAEEAAAQDAEEAATPEAPVEEKVADPTPAPEPETPPDDVAPDVKKDAPKKPAQAPKKAAPAATGTPGELALRSLQQDFEKLVDEAVQRKFRLQLSKLESDVAEKGEDPGFVRKVEDLHEQVKLALSKQQ